MIMVTLGEFDILQNILPHFPLHSEPSLRSFIMLHLQCVMPLCSLARTGMEQYLVMSLRFLINFGGNHFHKKSCAYHNMSLCEKINSVPAKTIALRLARVARQRQCSISQGEDLS